ncbi:DCC1-like thiol-disulfide oxidoreductase family protein [Mesorhizobium captivum]|uniref:DCC1-like thiol-disulfide oxidoreductase family protein n=1 Tax=Mesorhizobium captivum TaxID=3072319 RepID=UPI002A241FC0|nr:DCC1-like thiol-disulfide oxidoreductase family protein [Mesorhizobium sp. VK23E]MDX8513515.1 DCC1-like thiol-disulfide oxidoreductase family protein [Mesorhizobium sp. VK23E]
MVKSSIEIIYDGDCPFCSNYVRLVRIRDNFEVTLTDARAHPDLVKQLKAKGLDVDQGMIARIEGKNYFGSEAMSLISMLSSRSGMANRALSRLFRNRRLTALSYPILRFGRNLTLRVLGRSPL